MQVHMIGFAKKLFLIIYLWQKIEHASLTAHPGQGQIYWIKRQKRSLTKQNL